MLYVLNVCYMVWFLYDNDLHHERVKFGDHQVWNFWSCPWSVFELTGTLFFSICPCISPKLSLIRHPLKNCNTMYLKRTDKTFAYKTFDKTSAQIQIDYLLPSAFYKLQNLVSILSTICWDKIFCSIFKSPTHILESTFSLPGVSGSSCNSFVFGWI